jgi:hypothetical protein
VNVILAIARGTLMFKSINEIVHAGIGFVVGFVLAAVCASYGVLTY